MQKVYRLLRNNTEMGPYTLEELLHTSPQRHDLIWVEGKSASWSYPWEVEALKPYLAPAPHPAAGIGRPRSAAEPTGSKDDLHIFVSLPPRPKENPEPTPAADTLEQRAEALRRRVQQQTVAATALGTDPDALPQTNYARSLHEAEEEYTQWLYEKKKKQKSGLRKALATTGLVVVVFAGGLVAGQLLRKDHPAPASLPGAQSETSLSQEASLPAKQAAAFEETIPEVVPPDSVAQPQAAPATGSAEKKQPLAKKNEGAKDPAQGQQETLLVNEAPAPESNAPDSGTATVEPQAQASAPAVEKKKKAGLFSGLFKKRSKEPDQENAAADENENGGRKARRREAAQKPAANLAGQIELRSSVPQTNWMLGITGQKLTLLNHSSEVIKTAAVEVAYASEENGVLEKKTIYFSNVNPNSQATAALPDHRLAEKVSFRLLSATAGAAEKQ